MFRNLICLSLFLAFQFVALVGVLAQTPTSSPVSREALIGKVIDSVSADSVPIPPQGVYEREAIVQKLRPVPYTYVREADVLWSKIIWRTVDLRQKMNFPLYFPTVEMRDRKSLVQALYDAIQDNEIHAYDPQFSLSSPGDEFVSPLTQSGVRERMAGSDKVLNQVSMTTGRDTSWVIPAEIHWGEFKRLLIKEEWFFDTRHSQLQVRIIGLCPVREFIRTTENEEEGGGGELARTPAFWVYYPEARKVLAHVALFNPKNDAQVVSFDDLFFSRRFESFIIRESNEYNNRSISEYKKGGIPNMLESDRIHYDIMNKEHDLWEF